MRLTPSKASEMFKLHSYHRVTVNEYMVYSRRTSGIDLETLAIPLGRRSASSEMLVSAFTSGRNYGATP